MNRTVNVSSPAMPTLLGLPALEFKSIEGKEALGSLFRYTIDLQTPDSSSLTEYVSANVNIKTLVGKEFSVSIEIDGSGLNSTGAGTREINGLVTSGRFVRSEERRGIYQVVIEPWLVLATHTSDFKIFQNKTPLAIIQEVLADYPFPTETKTSHSYPLREFQVQYGESDLEFIDRLRQEFGIYYFFKHEGGTHKLVLVDDAGAHQPFPSAAYASVNYYPPGHKIDEEYCNYFQSSESLQPGKVVTDDFDFKKPRAKLQQKSSMPRNTGNNSQEHYRWPGDYTDPGEGTNLVKVRMEEEGAPGSQASGSGNLRAMVPGCTFSLAKYPQDKANQDYLIISASLSLHESAHAAGQGGWQCNTQFGLQPASKTFRSPQTQPKPHTTGPQTAIVTGPPGQEIWTNEYGQVKVSFHWNRYCTKDEKSSMWIRVSMPWAGTNFGGISIPRIGQEVIVDFENGDPDRPIIIGRVYNALNMPPWALPANQTQSWMLTRSTMGGSPGPGLKNGPGSANALRFEDKKGKEQLWIHAEKDQLTEVEHDEDKWVGNDRRKTIDRDEVSHIKRDRTETVDHDETITVHNDRTEVVDGHENITIHKTRTEVVDLDESLTVHKSQTFTVDDHRTKTIGKNETVKIGSNQAVTVGNNQTFTVGDNRTKTIGSNETDKIGKNWKINVGSMKTETIGLGYMETVSVFKVTSIGMVYSLNVGMFMNTVVGMVQSTQVGEKKTLNVGTTYTAKIGQTYDLTVGDRKTEKIGKVFVLEAGDHLELHCGAARIVMSGDNIYFSGTGIHFLGSTLHGDAGSIEWNTGSSKPAPATPPAAGAPAAGSA